MSEPGNAIEVSVSVELFQLVTGCIRLHSNEVQSLSDLKSLITTSIYGLPSFQGTDDESLLDHLEVMAAAGDIRIIVALDASVRAELDKSRAQLATRLGRDASFEETISALLFSFIVDRKANTARRMLEHDAAQRRDSRAEPPAGGNVIALR